MKLALIAIALASTIYGQSRFSVAKGDSGPIITNLGYNIKVNGDSSLHRIAFTINDETCPVHLSPSGAGTRYLERAYSFVAGGAFETRDAITAIEIRIILFDVFGARLRNLSLLQVADHAASTTIQLGDHSWYATENDVTEMMTTVAFVARVRRSSGAIWLFDPKEIAAQVSNIASEISAEDLKPETTKK